MTAPAKQLKEIVRLQFDVRRTQLNIIDNLVETCDLSSKKELFSNAMALIKWAVGETQKGRRIASYDPKKDEIEMVALPALNLITTTELNADGLVEVASGDATQTDRRRRRSVVSKRELGMV